MPASTLSRYVGTYDVDDGEKKRVVAVTLSGSTLAVDYEGRGKEQLIALSPTRFSWSGAIVEFSAGANGVVSIRIHYVEGEDRGPRRR